MGIKRHSGMLSACAAGVITLLSIQSSFAGGDLIPVGPKFLNPEPSPIVKSWTGFYVGGGLGVRQLKADIDIDSNLHSVSEDVHGCYLNEAESKKGSQGKVFDYGSQPNPKFLNKGADQDKKYDFAVQLLKCAFPKNVVNTNPRYKHFTSDLDFTHSESYSGDWKAFGTLIVGYDYQINDKLVAGVFGDITLGKADLNFAHTHTGTPVGVYHDGDNDHYPEFADEDESATISGKLKIENSLTLGARFGHLFNNKNTLGYLLAGYTRASVSGKIDMTSTGLNIGYNDANFIDPNTNRPTKSYRFVPTKSQSSFSETLNGITVGAGAEHKFNDNWSLRLEYRYTWYNSIKQKLQALEFSNDSLINGGGEWTWARSTENDTTVDIDPSEQSVRAVVTYKFNQ